MSIISPINDISPSDDPLTGSLRSTRKPGAFLETEEIQAILARSKACLDAGVAVHLSGPAGIGKTALAVRLAAGLERPMALLTGHEGLNRKDFVGQQIGHSEVVVDDKYIQSVRRRKTQSRIDWRDAMLSDAMRRGHTFIYDEFTRASPRTNALLLSVLEEGVLVTEGGAEGQGYVRAHPDFRVILTSNPSDYVAVNAAPDALLDRMVTFHLDGYSAETESRIVQAASGLDHHISTRVVEIVSQIRTGHAQALLPSMRTSILIGKLAQHAEAAGELTDERLQTFVSDVVTGRAPEVPESAIAKAVRATRTEKKGDA